MQEENQERVLEEGELMPFGHALEVLKHEKAGSHYLQSAHWLGGARIFIQKPDQDSKMTEPYFYLETKTSEGVRRGPIEFSSDLILSSDWLVAEVQ